MDIINEIMTTQNVNKSKTINKTKNLLNLRPYEYDFLYKEIMYKPTFHYVDENEVLNFIIKMEDKNEVESIINNKNVANIKLINEIPTLQIHVENMNKNFFFSFEVKELNYYLIRRFIQSKGGVIHFVIISNKEVIKCFSADISFKAETIKRFVYEIERAYYDEFPIVEFKEYKNSEATYLEIGNKDSFLEELLEITIKLAKWNSSDDFEIYVTKDENYKVYFSGIIKNLNYIKKEIQKKYKILNEEKTKTTGKPFLKYDYGRVYFLNKAE